MDTTKKPSDNPPWFPGAKVNWAENMLWCRDENKVALVEAGAYSPFSFCCDQWLRLVPRLCSGTNPATPEPSSPANDVCGTIRSCGGSRLRSIIARIATRRPSGVVLLELHRESHLST